MQPFVPYPYQQDAIQASLDMFDLDQHQHVLELPTGAGKTLISGAILKRFLGVGEYGLVLVPWLDLVEQTRKKYLDYFFDEGEVGVIQAEHHQPGRRITIASVDTLEQADRLASVLHRQHGRKFDAVILDECHRSLSASYRRILEALEAPGALRVGMSATPYRSDGQSLLKLFPHGVAYSIGFLELVVQGHLADVVPYDIETDLDLSSINVHGLYDDAEKLPVGLLEKIKASNRYARAYAAWQEFTRGEQRTLIFAQDVGDAYGFAKYFCEQGTQAEVITGRHGKGHREDIYGSFRRGDLKVICNYNVLSTGIDIPEIECIIIGRIMSRGTWIQATGRGLRLCPEIDKTHLTLLNLVDKQHTLTTMGELVGSMRDQTSVSSPSLRQALQEKLEEESQVPSVPPLALPLSIRVQLDQVKAKAYNVFTGDGWRYNAVTGDFTKDCGPLGTLMAERTFTGYTVYHKTKKGHTTFIQREVTDALSARAKAISYLERLRVREECREGTHPNLAKPIARMQLEYLSKRHVKTAPGMTQGDYYRIDAHLRKYGSAYPKDGPAIGYFQGRGVVEWYPKRASTQKGGGEREQ